MCLRWNIILGKGMCEGEKSSSRYLEVIGMSFFQGDTQPEQLAGPVERDAIAEQFSS